MSVVPPPSLRVLLTIHHGLDRNTGAPGVTVDLADELERRGCAVRTLSFDIFPTWVPERFKAMTFPLVVLAVVAASAVRSRIDVLDASTGDAALVHLLPRRLRPAATVTRSHGLEHLAFAEALEQAALGIAPLSARHQRYMRAFRLPAVRSSLVHADGVVALNAIERDYLRDALRSHAAALVSPNGLPDAFLHRLQAMGTHDPSPDVAFVGSYIARKGVHDLAAAMGQLLREEHGARLGVIGSGQPREAVLMDYPADVADRIVVVPRFGREDVAALLAPFGILAFPTLFEGASIALLEAMACGLVPVVTSGTGASELIEHEKNGLVVRPRAPGELREAILRLRADDGLRRELSAAARATAAGRAWSAVTDQTLDFYLSLLGHQ